MTRPTRDELIDAVQALLLRMPMNPGALHGKAADIVATPENPADKLETVLNPSFVMKAGKVYKHEE